MTSRTFTRAALSKLRRYAADNEETELMAFARSTLSDLERSATDTVTVDVPANLEQTLTRALGMTTAEAARQLDQMGKVWGV